MAKRKKTIADKSSGRRKDSRPAYLLRLEPDVFEKLKSEAAKAGLSMHQLLQGVLTWAADNIRQGRMVHTEDGEWYEEEAAECVWFGNPPEGGDPDRPDRFHFNLDYSGRRAINYEGPSDSKEDD